MTDLPYDTACLTTLTADESEINIKSINKCRMETMYSSGCIEDQIESMLMQNLSKLSKSDMASCMLVQRLGADTIKTAVVPMWIFYQFMVSVVLLRILIVMTTITYRKIYDNLDTQWK